MSKQRSFVITPNPAMSWNHLLLIYLIMSAVTLLIGIFFFIMGLTLILPFCGLDVIALGVALYVSARKGRLREVVTISDNKVVIESGHGHPETELEFPGPWTRIILDENDSSWLPSKLLIRSGCHQIEIGRFLHESERIELAKELKKAISRFV